MTPSRIARPAGAFPQPPEAGLTLLDPIHTPILGTSAAIARALETARRAALTDAAVFLTGESGTGKESIAQYIHAHSPRRRQRFVPINCAMPEVQLESELFDRRRGSFTGAGRDKPGALEVAHQGTLFLDDVIELPVAVQVKFLRLLQNSALPPALSGDETGRGVVDVRVISATNRDPDDAIRSGRLREDLYFQLDVVPIHLPPLRERPEDIPVLASHLLRRLWERHRGSSVPLPTLSPEAVWALGAHPWRGNIRELQNTIEHLVVLADPGVPIPPDQIPFRRDPAPVEARTDSYAGGYRSARNRVIAAFEAGYLEWFVRRAGRNFSKAARAAGIDRTTLYRLLERHGLRRPQP